MIVGVAEVILAIRIAVPPGVTPEVAAKMVANNGASLSFGLLPFVRQIHTDIVQAGASSLIPALEGAAKVEKLS